MGFARHARFFVALLLGGALYLCPGVPEELRALVAVNGFFAAYLALMLMLAARLTHDHLRAKAEIEDEGAVLILGLAVLAVAFSLGAIITVLQDDSRSLAQAALALASVPLGWASLHVMASYRYAHLHFAEETGLDFPGETPPDIWDFFYFGFTMGMTAQTSDVQVTTQRLRRMVLFHGIGSFFYNTVLIALAVNAALNLGN